MPSVNETSLAIAKAIGLDTENLVSVHMTLKPNEPPRVLAEYLKDGEKLAKDLKIFHVTERP